MVADAVTGPAASTKECIAWHPVVPDAVAAIFRRYGVRAAELDRDDVVSEVRMRLVEMDYDPSRCSPSTFAWLQARHVVRTKLRDRHRESASRARYIARRGCSQSALDDANHDRHGVASDILNRCNNTRDYLLLRAVQTVGYQRAALAFNIPDGTVRSLVWHVLVRLRESSR